MNDLSSRYLAGAPLTSTEETELLRMLEADETLRTEFTADAQIDGLLRAVDRLDRDAEDFRRGVLQSLSAQEDGSRFIARVQSRLRKEVTPRGLRRVRLRQGGRPNALPLWIGILAAAAILIVLAVSFAGSPAVPPPPPRVDTARTPEPSPDAAAPAIVREPKPVARALPRLPKPPVATSPGKSAVSPIEPGTPPKSPAPDTTPDPAPPPKPPAPRTTSTAAVATVEGDVTVAGARTTTVLAGQGVEAAGDGRLLFPDGSRITLEPGTTIRSVKSEGGKRVFLTTGSVTADIARQPLRFPMIFETPHGNATVLGTIFRLDVGDATTLTVTEGRVRLSRTGDRKSVVVTAGRRATTKDLKSRPFPADPILLRPADAKLVGTQWALVRDPDTSGGTALEGRQSSYRTSPGGNPYELSGPRSSFVTFVFDADAGKDYHVWIRGRTTATTRRNYYDEVVLVPAEGDVSLTADYISKTDPTGALYNGFSRTPGYGWVGGLGEGDKDTVPIRIRFRRPGTQVLRMYCVEPVIRIDAIWLSTTQRARPAADQTGPR